MFRRRVASAATLRILVEASSEAAAHADGLAVEELAEQARADGRLAIDTEFVSEGRYRPLLCLVQVALAPRGQPANSRIELLDPLAGGFDPGPLADVVADPEVELVLHAGAQDVAILRREWGIQPRNV